MKYDDLEKTRDLFDIPDGDVPTPIEDLDSEGVSKETIDEDLTFGLSGEDAVALQKEEPELLEEEQKGKKKKKKENKPKRKFREVWKEFSKKKKAIIILIPILLILVIVGVVLFFVLRKEEEVKPEPDEPEVIVEMDNYIYQDGTLIFLNSNGDEIGTYECVNKSEDLCFVPTYSEEDEFDGPRNVYQDESVVLRQSKIYHDKYAFVFDHESVEDEGIILYNIEDQENMDTYKLIKGFSDSDLVILKDSDNRYGLLELGNDITEILEFSYDYIGRMNSEANLVVNTNARYYIYDTEGKSLSQGLRYEIKSYNDEYIVVDSNGYYVYDYEGNLLFDDAYDYIELLDDYAILIDSNKVFIKDYQNNKYNEEGIEIDSTYYNPLNIYNEDKVFVETKRAYEIAINEGVLDVTYEKNNRERTTSINLQDGIMSAKYDSISYFDGTLYFYQDEDKTDILGTYQCSNENATDLTNCTIATDSFYSHNDLEEDKSESVGWIPIYNNRYVFILDTIDLNNPSIILYDLETSKDLARYSTVDSGAYTGKKEVTFITTDAVYIMAQAKSDKEYGLIRISDNVAGTIGFDYDFIEKLGEYYQVGTSTGTYKLYQNVGGDPLTAEYAGKIINYVDNYVLVNDDNQYYVYDFKGNPLRKEDGAYRYVDLEDNYYVVVNSKNKLNIHLYSDPEFTLSEPIDVGTENYEGAFSVTASNGGFVVTITSTNTTYTFDSNGLVQVSS